MLYHRQRLLLALLSALGGSASHLDFHKLLFLFCHEEEDSPSYEFVPYKYGGFSFTSYADHYRLVEKGLLNDRDKTWSLTAEGEAAARLPAAKSIPLRRFVQTQKRRGEALIAEVYRRHPWYAINSEIAERVLVQDPDAQQRIERARPQARPAGLCTIGYEGRSLEAYLNKLVQNGVTLLCDVRRNPLSRKYGFSRKTLSGACEKIGIRYEHLPQLGIASAQRRELKTQADYDALFELYERDDLPRQGEALSTIRSWIHDEGQRVALTCFEAHPHQCHRHCVAEAIIEQDSELSVVIDL